MLLAKQTKTHFKQLKTKIMTEIIKLTEQENSISESKQFLQFVEAAEKIKQSCLAIKINDQNSYDDANQRIVSAKKIIKEIDNTRLSATKDYRDKVDIINNLGNRLKKIVEDGVKYGSSVIISYNQELEKKKQEELKRIIEEQRKRDSVKMKINDAFDIITNNICSCKTLDSLQKQIFPKHVKNDKGDSTLQILEKLVKDINDEAITEIFNSTCQKIMSIGKDVKIKIQSGEIVDDSIIEKIEEAKQEQTNIIDDVAIETHAKIKAIENNKVKNQRLKITYSLSDIDKVPEEYKKTILDEDAIALYIKTHGVNIFEEGFNAIPGVRFTKEYSHVSK